MVLAVACVQKTSVDLEQVYAEFSSAPDSTRTKVWWFHGETATTMEGITADLEAFKEAGVGGVVYYDQIHGDGAGASAIFSREWWDALIFSAQEARRLGLTFEINISNGFVAGGPWITKELSMKRLCSSETVLKAGESWSGKLPAPSQDEFWDVATLAFPVPASIKWESRTLVDKTLKFNEAVVLSYDFGEPFTSRSLTYSEFCTSKHPTLAMNWPGEPSDNFYGDGFIVMPALGELQCSADGVNWTTVREIPCLYNIHNRVKTISFPAVTARYFRLNLHDWNRTDGQRTRTLELRSAKLNSAAMTDEWENKAGINSEYVRDNNTPDYSVSEIIDAERIINISGLVDKNGELKWTAPQGEEDWVVLRVAQTSTRGHTKHGRPGQMGLETDKLWSKPSEVQWDNFAQVIIDTLTNRGLRPDGVIMDSHEMGSQNWTFDYAQRFKDFKGYDIIDYLPALLGYVVDSKDKTDELLLDHRQTIAHLVNTRYFAALDSIAISKNMQFTAQATGNGQSMTSDNIAAKGAVRRPQGEFWGKHNEGSYDIKEAASAAHIYGKPIASAEAYTDAKYSQSLAYLKNLADYSYAFHLNEFVVCASAYQPWLDKYPGNTANGREYCLNRNNTMWPLSRGFWDYQSRAAYMMRQGEPVVDLLIYTGSEVSMKLLSHMLPQIPEGYDWDVCTDNALLNVISAKKGRVVCKSGMSYAALIIERLAHLTPEAEAKIAQLKKNGVPVYDARVEGDYALGAFLNKASIAPDAEFHSDNTVKSKIYFGHRRTAEAEIYFFNNHSDKMFSQSISFRDAAGKLAEYWDPDSGRRLVLGSEDDSQGRLCIELALAPRESGFVVLREAGSMPESEIERTYGQSESIYPVEGVWAVDFYLPAGVRRVNMPKLSDWREFRDEELRYHSGTAVYQKMIDISKAEDKRVYLRINGLHACSRIWLNDKEAGYIWCAPWEKDITDYLKDGENKLAIEVANQLTNRMIGDLYLPENQRITYATKALVQKGDELLPAGITGGVELVVR